MGLRTRQRPIMSPYRHHVCSALYILSPLHSRHHLGALLHNTFTSLSAPILFTFFPPSSRLPCLSVPRFSPLLSVVPVIKVSWSAWVRRTATSVTRPSLSVGFLRSAILSSTV